MPAAQVGPHVFEEGSLVCRRCPATRAAAELDADGIPTVNGLPYASYPNCLGEGENPAKTGLVRRLPGLVMRSIRLGM
jgi:hypothetical protein